MSYPVTTSTSAVRAVIEPEVEAAWAALGYSIETIEWPNRRFSRPCSGAWMRVSYPQQSTFPFTWGGPGNVVQNRTLALLAIQIFAPKNAGNAVLIAATDRFRSTFERRTFGDGVRFREALGPSESLEDTWAASTFTFPYEYIEEITLT